MDSYVKSGNGNKNVFCVGLLGILCWQTLHNCTLKDTDQDTFF